jgi:hypothetical protein
MAQAGDATGFCNADLRSLTYAGSRLRQDEMTELDEDHQRRVDRRRRGFAQANAAELRASGLLQSPRRSGRADVRDMSELGDEEKARTS